MSSLISNPSISDVGEKWTKTEILYRKVCRITNAFEAFKVFRGSKQIPVVYSAPVKGPKKFTIYFIDLFICIDIPSYTTPIPTLFPKYLAVPLYLNVTPHFTWGVHCERTDGILKKRTYLWSLNRSPCPQSHRHADGMFRPISIIIQIWIKSIIRSGNTFNPKLLSWKLSPRSWALGQSHELRWCWWNFWNNIYHHTNCQKIGVMSS